MPDLLRCIFRRPLTAKAGCVACHARGCCAAGRLGCKPNISDYPTILGQDPTCAHPNIGGRPRLLGDDVSENAQNPFSDGLCVFLYNAALSSTRSHPHEPRNPCFPFRKRHPHSRAIRRTRLSRIRHERGQRPCAARSFRRPEARAAAHPLCHARHGADGGRKAREVCPRGGRDFGQIPPARRQLGL